jgi:VWFA-related protein
MNVIVRRAALAGALSLALAAAAQQPADSPLLREGIRRAVEVKAMDLDVVAATRDGQPVNDLKKDEFVVKVDGKPVALDYFARIEAGTLHGPDLAGASPDLILETTAGDRGDRYLARQFLVFFDDEHLLPFERSRVIEGLRDFVSRLTPSDRVSILSYGSMSRMIIPFTSSKEELLDGLSRLEKKAPGGLRWDSDYKRTAIEVQRSRAQTRSVRIREWAQQAYTRDKSTLEDLRRAVAALAARSGKRVLIYVSNGLELHPGRVLATSLGPFGVNQFEYSVVEDVRAVVSEANRAGITVHALDARGLTTDVDASDSNPSPLAGFFQNQTLREPLAQMAAETGGVLLANRNVFQQGFDRIYQDASTYYSLGVTLTNVAARE